jgi:hypothetical protein
LNKKLEHVQKNFPLLSSIQLTNVLASCNTEVSLKYKSLYKQPYIYMIYIWVYPIYFRIVHHYIFFFFPLCTWCHMVHNRGWLVGKDKDTNYYHHVMTTTYLRHLTNLCLRIWHREPQSKWTPPPELLLPLPTFLTIGSNFITRFNWLPQPHAAIYLQHWKQYWAMLTNCCSCLQHVAFIFYWPIESCR